MKNLVNLYIPKYKEQLTIERDWTVDISPLHINRSMGKILEYDRAYIHDIGYPEAGNDYYYVWLPKDLGKQVRSNDKKFDWQTARIENWKICGPRKKELLLEASYTFPKGTVLEIVKLETGEKVYRDQMIFKIISMPEKPFKDITFSLEIEKVNDLFCSFGE